MYWIWMVIFADSVLSIIGGILMKRLKITKEISLKILIIFLVIGISSLILYLNHKFIDSSYNWVISVIFIAGMFIEYLRPSTSEKETLFQDNYRGD